MNRRKNVLMDVTPKPAPPEERVPTPPPPLPKPTEKDIFKQPLPTVDESVEEDPEGTNLIPQVAPPKNPPPVAKPQYTPAEPINIPQRPTTNWIPSNAPATQRPTTNFDIDYDRIISGVAGRMNTKQVEEDAMTLLEKRIREEERAKAAKQYSEYFVDAASKPFGAYAYDKTSANPFDKCFN